MKIITFKNKNIIYSKVKKVIIFCGKNLENNEKSRSFPQLSGKRGEEFRHIFFSSIIYYVFPSSLSYHTTLLTHSQTKLFSFPILITH